MSWQVSYGSFLSFLGPLFTSQLQFFSIIKTITFGSPNHKQFNLHLENKSQTNTIKEGYVLKRKVFDGLFENEKNGLVPNTSWKKNALGRNWLLGETIITGIGQGYIQTTPIQLCLSLIHI